MITRAAIKHKSESLDSVIFVGKEGDRHNNIIRAMVEEFELPPPITGDMGFTDQDGKFYSREDAKRHAIDCGQLENGTISSTLTSEDLW